MIVNYVPRHPFDTPDAAAKAMLIISERIDQALRTIRVRTFHAHREGHPCVLQLHHEDGIRVILRDRSTYTSTSSLPHYRYDPTNISSQHAAAIVQRVESGLGTTPSDTDLDEIEGRLAFVIPFTALAAVRPVVESNSLEFETKVGTHHKPVERVQVRTPSQVCIYFFCFEVLYLS